MRLNERRVMLLGGLDRSMPEQQAHGADVGAALEQPTGERVAEPMWVGMDLCDLAESSDYTAELVYARVEFAGSPEETLRLLRQRSEGVLDAWVKEQADWYASLLSAPNCKVAALNAGPHERRRITDAEPRMEQKQDEGASANPTEIDERWVIVRETITRREDGIGLGDGERQSGGAGVFRHTQSPCGVPFNPSAIRGELKELSNNLQFSPAGGRCDGARGAVTSQSVQTDLANRLRAVRFSHMPQGVRVLAQRRFGKAARFGVGKKRIGRFADRHLGRKASIDLAGFEQSNSVDRTIPRPSLKGSPIATARQVSIAPDGATAPLPTNSLVAMGAGFQMAAVGLQHGADSIIRGTRFGTRPERASECQ